MNTVTTVTRRDLAEKGLEALAGNATQHQAIAVSRSAGGVSFASVSEVMEVAKLMAVADKAVPAHLRANPGACLRIVFQAVEWQMSPWSVADKSYEVNDRIAYESQLIHAVIEARAPLRKRLEVEYIGDEGSPDRRCKIVGTFTDGEKREYLSPKFKDIKVKNSPLWVADQDQQFFYYSSRGWSRRWCPDVIMGLYTPDEMRDNPALGRPEEEPDGGLKARLIGSNVSREEGHKDGHVEKELNGGKDEPTASAAPAEAAETATEEEPSGIGPETPLKDVGFKSATLKILEREGLQCVSHVCTLTEVQLLAFKGAGQAFLRDVKDSLGKHGFVLQTGETGPAAPAEAEATTPKTPGQWVAYCTGWINAGTDVANLRDRWDRERKLRSECGVVSEERDPVMKLLGEKCKALGEPAK